METGNRERLRGSIGNLEGGEIAGMGMGDRRKLKYGCFQQCFLGKSRDDAVSYTVGLENIRG
eukprot:898063-Amorphochlora_amoeboformis.AAC.1